MPRKPPLPCLPGEHRFQAHEHVRMDDGRPKPCAGRFWCLKCLAWLSGPACVLPGAPKLPAGWLR
jgi:hypothetical protein